MQRSTDRILTTHAGTLPHPEALERAASARARDPKAYEAALAQSVTTVVAKQIETGIDVPDDGEFGKTSWTGYVSERLGGFEQQPVGEGWLGPMQVSQDRRDFTAYYEEATQAGTLWYRPLASRGSPIAPAGAPTQWVCT